MNKRKPQTVQMTNVDEPELEDCLSAKQLAFVRELCVDWCATKAAIRAGYAENSAAEQSSRLLTKDKIKAAVARRMAAAADVAEADAALIISEIYQIATADPRDLVSVHRGACRFCFGIGGDRQWTVGEYQDAWHEALAADPNAAAPPMRGGIAYDFTLAPNPDCCECRGYGTERVFVKDTRKLSRGAAKLIAGVKQTRDGIEIKQHDKMAALLALGKIRGIYAPDRSEVSGPNGGPVALTAVPNFQAMTNEELQSYLSKRNAPLTIEGSK